jgi:hypothetical protein
MGFLDVFRRKPPIRDAAALAEFIEGNAAFLVQKGIYEYSRARAGHYAKVLFREPEFLEAVEVSRWRAYPLGLAMVAEIVDGVLRESGAGRAPGGDAFAASVLEIFDRFPAPPALGAESWSALRADLARRLQLITLHPPKRAMDVSEPFAQVYFDLMPIHEKLRGRDLLTTRNYLRVTLCNIHEEFARRVDAPAVAAALALEPA